MVCDRVSGMSANARTGVRAGPLAKQDCNDAVATDEVREASRSHALDSPLPGEGREPERQVSMWVSVCCALAGGAPYSTMPQRRLYFDQTSSQRECRVSGQELGNLGHGSPAELRIGGKLGPKNSSIALRTRRSSADRSSPSGL